VTRRIIISFILLALFLFLIQVNTRAYSIWYEYLMSDIDSSTEGKILSIRKDYASGSGRGAGFHRYHFNYIYYIDGVPYTGHIFSHEGLAMPEDVTEKYSEASVVTIHYDSDNPYYSAIEVRDPGYRMYGAFLPLIFFFLYVVVVPFIWRGEVA